MKRSILLSIVLAGAATESSQAANLTALTQPPTLMNLVIFVIAVVCLVFCLQVISLVRGGYLTKSWQFFLTGFVLLALSQLGRVLSSIEVFTAPDWVSPVLLILMTAAFLMGLLQTRRLLS
ncbi:MAG: hypothetical protein D6800_04565 [Candidatus Zixiibacteriota bacterium]|nr:MAG: hypothetical protein D6800_04565 [candidate division Zixibacteria bacterium]